MDLKLINDTGKPAATLSASDALFARALPLLRTHVRPIYVKLGILAAAELSVPPERN